LVVQGSPNSKSAKQAIEEQKVTSIPKGLQGMVKEMKPTYERKQMLAILDSLRKFESLKVLLHGIEPE
jgi:hypothetical protein